MAKARTLSLPGGVFEFFGVPYYGTCASASNSQYKIVNVPGFEWQEISTGAVVYVRFENSQDYDGEIKLQINGVAKTVYVGAQEGTKGEWRTGDVVAFSYNGTAWVIIGGSHASTAAYGRTMLTNTISSDETKALTPKAVNDAGYLTLATLPIYTGTVQ